MSKPRAVVYKRQSSFREESISLELQERACRDYAKAQGYTVVAVEEDPGISGRTWNRPGVQKVMELVEAEEADVIILWKWSRLSRSRLDWAVAADRVETMGGRIESATEQIDVSTSTGRLARGMLTEFAAFESERIGDGWKEAHMRRTRNGLPHSGKPRFGYDYAKGVGYTPNADAETMRQLYLRYIQGHSFRMLFAYLEAEAGSVPGMKEATSLRRTMDLGFAAGYIIAQEKQVKGSHEAIISEEVWNTYCVRRRERGSRPRAENTDYAYSGLLRCFCGGGMHGGSVASGAKSYRRYTCDQSQQRLRHTVTSVSELQVEKAVLAWLKSVAAEVDAAAKTVKAEPVGGSMRAKAAQIKADLTQTIKRLDSLTVKYLDDEVSPSVYVRLKDKLEADKAALEARQRLVEVNATVKPQKIVPQLLAGWADAPARVKRETLRALGVTIHLHDWENGVRTGSRRLEIPDPWE